MIGSALAPDMLVYICWDCWLSRCIGPRWIIFQAEAQDFIAQFKFWRTPYTRGVQLPSVILRDSILRFVERWRSRVQSRRLRRQSPRRWRNYGWNARSKSQLKCKESTDPPTYLSNPWNLFYNEFTTPLQIKASYSTALLLFPSFFALYFDLELCEGEWSLKDWILKFCSRWFGFWICSWFRVVIVDVV